MPRARDLRDDIEEIEERLTRAEKRVMELIPRPKKKRGKYKLKPGKRAPGLTKAQEQLLEKLRGKR